MPVSKRAIQLMQINTAILKIIDEVAQGTIEQEEGDDLLREAHHLRAEIISKLEV